MNYGLLVLLAAFVAGCGAGGDAGTGGTGGTAGAGGVGAMGGEGGGGATGQVIEISEEMAEPRTLPRYFVNDAAARNALCNDGTDSAYYFDAASGSGRGKWIIHLQGGGACGSPEACLQRAEAYPDRVSSAPAPDTVVLDGMFAEDAELNPDFFNWNVVHLDYCSSDGWRGNRAATEEPGGFHFRGYNIITAVLEDLQSEADFGSDNLANATSVIFTGSSAGGNGAKHNLDRVAEMLPWAEVRGFIELFAKRETLGLPPAAKSDFSERVAYQGHVFDESCAAAEPNPETCSEPLIVGLEYLETPFFAVQDQIDPRVLVLAVDHTAEREALFAEGVRDVIRDHGAGFSSLFGYHTWGPYPQAYQYKIDGVSMLDALSNWYFDRSGLKLVVQEP